MGLWVGSIEVLAEGIWVSRLEKIMLRDLGGDG